MLFKHGHNGRIVTGNRDGREEGIKIASGQTIRDAEKARGNRTYYDANGRPYKITDNGREYVKQETKGA